MLTPIALALAPVGAIILYFYSRDKYDKEPKALLIKAFALGLLSVFPAFVGSAFGSYLGFDISLNIYITFVYAFFVVALSEELAKYLLLRYGLFNHSELNEPYDGILYSVMVGMGFAAFENVLYVLEGGIGSAILRMFTAVPAHATFGAIMGYYVGMAKFDPKNRGILLAKGLGVAVFMHGLYDFFLMQLIYEGMFLGAIASLIISIVYIQKAIKWQQQISPFNPQNTTNNQIQQQDINKHAQAAIPPINAEHPTTMTDITANDSLQSLPNLSSDNNSIATNHSDANKMDDHKDRLALKPDFETEKLANYDDVFIENNLTIAPDQPPTQA